MIKRANAKLMVLVTVVIIMVLSMTFAATANANRKVQTDTKQKYYTSVYIESGETLWHLAETYADKDYYSSNLQYIKEIKKMNNLKSDHIKQGTYLLVTYYN